MIGVIGAVLGRNEGGSAGEGKTAAAFLSINPRNYLPISLDPSRRPRPTSSRL